MGESWIFEGGFSTIYEHGLSRSDMAIWLDLPVAVRLWRVRKCLLLYWAQQRPDMAPGCHAGMRRETWAFFVWIWTSRSSGCAKLVALFAPAPRHIRVHHLTSRAAVRRFPEGLPC